jgi:hypothetical protein
MDVFETRVLSNTKSILYRLAVLCVNAVIYLSIIETGEQ